jgi:hypothetical protein
MSGLTGSVVHLALKVVTKALARAGCRSLEDTNALQVMRDLGGYTKVIDDCIQQVLHGFVANPRAEPLLDTAFRTLKSRVPEMRIETQTLLRHITLHEASGTSGNEPARKNGARMPLGPGTYPELILRAPRIGWHGITDLLILSPSVCEIIDFKTGSMDDAHRFQLGVYALLWSRDSELNPTGRTVDRLTLQYQDREVSVDPPTTAQLDALERDLIGRRQAAVAALNADPPQARPSVDNCRHCAVRHLCDEYWEQVPTPVAPSESAFTDVQIAIVGRHGRSSWDGIIERSLGKDAAKSIVLRIPGSSDLEFAKGDRIRALDVHVSTVDDANVPIVATMSSISEVFIL